MSLGSILGATGLALVVVEDPERVRLKFAERQQRQARPGNRNWQPLSPADDAEPVSMTDEARLLQNVMRRNGRKGVRARMKKLTPEQRSAIARKAARSRWANSSGS